MSASTTYARIFLFVVLVNAFCMSMAPMLDPPWHWWQTWIPLFVKGQLTLLVMVAALATAPSYVRWPCLVPIAYWLSRDLPSPPRWTFPPHYYWQRDFVLWTAPHTLTVLMVLFLLRELGLRIVADEDIQPWPHNWRRFSLRRLFVWTAAAAVLSLGWKRLFHWQQDLAYLRLFTHWQLVLKNLVAAVPQTMLDWMAVQFVLGRPRLIARLAWLPLFAIAVLVQAVASELYREAMGGMIQSWLRDAWPICWYDLLYLAPVVAVLLLARAAGYRLAWTGSSVE